MDDLEKQLLRLNRLSEGLYQYVEAEHVKPTRRRLLTVQCLVFTDINTNAIYRLVGTPPAYPDGAAMMLRSILDLSITTVWILKYKSNERLWRWLRDDKKTLHTQLKNIVSLKTINPKLNDKSHPFSVWQNALTLTEKEVIRLGKKAGTSLNEREISLFQKAKTGGQQSQIIYNTVFWLLSGKTHATPTGLMETITLNPTKIARRDGDSDEEHCRKLLEVALLWYCGHAKRVAFYFKAPQYDEINSLLKELMKRGKPSAR